MNNYSRDDSYFNKKSLESFLYFVAYSIIIIFPTMIELSFNFVTTCILVLSFIYLLHLILKPSIAFVIRKVMPRWLRIKKRPVYMGYIILYLAVRMTWDI
ncbi:hypothetical protein CQU01_03610 [Cerasibacillus quisquiliarum]|uniref:Uncharacterized protein n=1 Tax=Cerasibacillus quisquiliarum TaxID=227865 RepID=A0A511UXC6_9BACI|nr:hypothetical protein CQU01_03610 [Cerasibacillus quisquiliarum]